MVSTAPSRTMRAWWWHNVCDVMTRPSIIQCSCTRVIVLTVVVQSRLYVGHGSAYTVCCMIIRSRSCSNDLDTPGYTQFMYRFRNNERTTVEKGNTENKSHQMVPRHERMNVRAREGRSEGARARKPISHHHYIFLPRTSTTDKEEIDLDDIPEKRLLLMCTIK